jgi:hypothetical protein
LAKEGGFTESELMEMPVYRVNAYYHAALRSHDLWTVPVSAPVESQVEDLVALLSLDMGRDE